MIIAIATPRKVALPRLESIILQNLPIILSEFFFFPIIPKIMLIYLHIIIL